MRTVEMIKVESILIDKLPMNESVLSLVFFLLTKGNENLPPIKVQRAHSGGYKLKDGRHRVAAYKLMGWKEIKATFYIPETNRTEKDDKQIICEVCHSESCYKCLIKDL